jgi:hypothetical protein
VPDRPKYGDPVQLVECVGSINEQKFSLFLFLMLLPELIDGMDSAFDACF